MPLTSVETYSEPEQLEAAYAAATVELTPTASVPFEARVVRLELDRVWIQRVYEAVPRIKWAAQSPKRAFIRFLTEPGAELVADGVPLPFGELIYHGRANRYYENSSGPIRWAGVSLPVEDLAFTGSALAGCDLSPSCENRRIIPPLDALTRLQRLHAAAAALAEHAPHIIRAREAVHGLEQSLVQALVDCLSDRERRVPTRAQGSHEIVMRRFHGMLEADPDRAFYVPEICAAIGVPERTLRFCCQERLGMSPKQYLMLRRMQLVRRDLHAATPALTTVTDTATRFGFWHFGRFAGTYRRLFGESPSATLSRPPD